MHLDPLESQAALEALDLWESRASPERRDSMATLAIQARRVFLDQQVTALFLAVDSWVIICNDCIIRYKFI